MSIKKIIIPIFLALIFIPFILIKDVYPFFRFGMYAEPVSQEEGVEKFVVFYDSFNGTRSTFYPSEIGMNANNFAYLARNYFYRGEANLLLENIHVAMANPQVETWSLCQIKIKETQADTTLVFTWQVDGNFN